MNKLFMFGAIIGASVALVKYMKKRTGDNQNTIPPQEEQMATVA